MKPARNEIAVWGTLIEGACDRETADTSERNKVHDK